MSDRCVERLQRSNYRRHKFISHTNDKNIDLRINSLNMYSLPNSSLDRFGKVSFKLDFQRIISRLFNLAYFNAMFV